MAYFIHTILMGDVSRGIDFSTKRGGAAYLLEVFISDTRLAGPAKDWPSHSGETRKNRRLCGFLCRCSQVLNGDWRATRSR